MKHTWIYILVTALILGVVFMFGLHNEKDAEIDNRNDVMIMEEDVQDVSDNIMMVEDESRGDGGYMPYTSESVSAAAREGQVILFFRANWCPTCRAVDTDIRAHANDIPKGVTIFDVNYDAAHELKAQYGVTYQHTFVQIDAEGELVKKWNGSSTLAEVVAEIE